MTQSKKADRAAPGAFLVRDCALIALATGKKARLLQTFRQIVAEIDAASIYHHFWGGLLQPRFEEREYNNDFASWVQRGLHDAVLAEQLASINPLAFSELEALRREILDLIDARLDEVDHLAWLPATQQFEFICAQIVVFDANRQLTAPEELVEVVPRLSTSSIFYHFVDARRRTADGRDDFSDWLMAFDGRYEPLRQRLAGVDPYFGNLSELREELSEVFSEHLKGGVS